VPAAAKGLPATPAASPQPASVPAVGSGPDKSGADKGVAASGAGPTIAPAAEASDATEKGKTVHREGAAGKPVSAKQDPEQDLLSATGVAAENPKAVQSYCVNISNPALDARYLRQKKQLEELRTDIEKRAAALEGRISDYKDWLTRREEFANKARDSLVSIYASMKTESAAKQLAELDEETASSLLSKLDSRQSSAILGEMDAKKAARLMEIVSGASRLSEGEGAVAEDLSGAASEASPGPGVSHNPAEKGVVTQ
jgi:flagellar motility protein MotE (MotC chaperone)